MEPNAPKLDVSHLLLRLSVRTPEKVEYEGEAKSVSSINENGPFDILPAHQNFITLIKEKLVIYDAAGEKQDIPVKSGVIRVHENDVTIFLGVEALQPDGDQVGDVVEGVGSRE